VDVTDAGDPPMTPVAQADSVQDWLIKGARPAGKASGASETEAKAPPRAETSGALIDRVAVLNARIAPTGSKLLSAVQYPDLRAATTTFSAGVHQVSLTVHRLPAPVYVADLTMGFPEDTYQEWSDGTRVVIVRHALPQTFQVIAVRGKGVMLTVSVAVLGTDGVITARSDLFAAWSGVDQLVQRVKDVASDAALDGFAANSPNEQLLHP
jgi:hypothetical protein